MQQKSTNKYSPCLILKLPKKARDSKRKILIMIFLDMNRTNCANMKKRCQCSLIHQDVKILTISLSNRFCSLTSWPMSIVTCIFIQTWIACSWIFNVKYYFYSCSNSGIWTAGYSYNEVVYKGCLHEGWQMRTQGRGLESMRTSTKEQLTITC